MTKKAYILLIFLFALVERVWFDLGPNIELITLLTILSVFYLNKGGAFLLTFIVIALSDLLIGNTNIFIFTWSGFLIPIFVLKIFKNLIAKLDLKVNNILSGTLAGISSNLFFFLWTNFGVWLLDSWGMYPNTAQGLLQSYINGLPFLKYQLVSTLTFVPLGLMLLDTSFQKMFKKVILLFRTNFTISHMSSS